PSHPLPPSRTVRSFRQHFLICKILCCLFRYATELTKVNFLLFKIHKMMLQKPKCILSDLNDGNPAENRSCSQPDHTAVRGLGLPATATGKHANGGRNTVGYIPAIHISYPFDRIQRKTSTLEASLREFATDCTANAARLNRKD